MAITVAGCAGGRDFALGSPARRVECTSQLTVAVLASRVKQTVGDRGILVPHRIQSMVDMYLYEIILRTDNKFHYTFCSRVSAQLQLVQAPMA